MPDSTVLNGSTFASSGFALTANGIRSKQYATCVYIRCSTHFVSPWSKEAMCSAGGTNFGLPWVVVACTNVRIACLAGPSFHEGSGSALCYAGASAASCAMSTPAKHIIHFVFLGKFSSVLSLVLIYTTATSDLT
ncbi:MAG TPA: hypothetical protein VLG48_01200, partial [Candidatus Methylomirabilis sp.]|nr:hypothetical protein [Candidatus Methylomirabilis sp.]